MTDNEIIKVLECCSKESGCPDDCLGRKVGCELEGYALNLINRQKAKIEALQKDNMILRDVICARDTKIEILQSKKCEQLPQLANKI